MQQQADIYSAPTVHVGDTIAGHRIQSFLGRGGMGQVFLAEHPRVGRCAIKLAPADSTLGPGSTDVRREAALMSTVNHPRISRPLGSGLAVTSTGQSVTWMTMRQVTGVDLTRAGRLTTGEILDVTRWVGGALDHIHAAGIIHCDVKAANIMVERNHLGRAHGAVLVDFGIARYWQRVPGAFDPTFVGTLTTAPPEALRGQPCGPQADQYGLACTVYAMLAGYPPFIDDGTLQSALAARSVRSPQPLGALDPVLAGFDAPLRRALASEPADRFATCGDFAAALRAQAVSRLWVDTAPPSINDPAHLRLPATLIPQ